MTREQMRRIVRNFYQLKRPVTDAELDAEVSNLHRKARAGALCDLAAHLYARLNLSEVQS